MRRKVIQIAESTMLVSLPKKWATEHGVKKGDEINVEANGSHLIISTDTKPVVVCSEVNLDKFDGMSSRVITSLYKKGVDEIKINFNGPSEFKVIQESIKNATVGYEVLEQTTNHCVIKNVAGQLEEFDSMLRRVFLLIITMAGEGLNALKNKDVTRLGNIEQLEKSNNRLTTMCRRYI